MKTTMDPAGRLVIPRQIRREAGLEFLRGAAADGIAGGRIYDAVIAGCARRGGVDAVLTFNERDYASLASHGIALVIPSTD
jgi:hypothetical protein